tara:strand:- start:60 stop:434 length:375 start_codon:yes stop_codon:yes gene_type:complete
MSNLKSIGNKLFKEATELKSHEVELNMVKSVESNSKKAESLYTQGVKEIFSAIRVIESAIQTLKKSKSIANNSLSEGKELEKLADKIGADLKSSTESAIQNAFNTIQAAEQNIKDLEKAKATIQ